MTRFCAINLYGLYLACKWVKLWKSNVHDMLCQMQSIIFIIYQRYIIYIRACRFPCSLSSRNILALSLDSFGFISFDSCLLNSVLTVTTFYHKLFLLKWKSLVPLRSIALTWVLLGRVLFTGVPFQLFALVTCLFVSFLLYRSVDEGGFHRLDSFYLASFTIL